jgi:hypothetical protein
MYVSGFMPNSVASLATESILFLSSFLLSHVASAIPVNDSSIAAHLSGFLSSRQLVYARF